MILFNGVNPILMTTLEDGSPGFSGLVGFGTSGQGPSPLTSTLNVEGMGGYGSSFYFTVPFAMEINSLLAFFVTNRLSAQTSPTVTISAQLYEAKEESDIFSAIEETLVTLTPSVTEATPIGTMLRGEIQTKRLVEKNTRLMLVFFTTANGPEQVDAFLGSARASLVYT